MAAVTDVVNAYSGTVGLKYIENIKNFVTIGLYADVRSVLNSWEQAGQHETVTDFLILKSTHLQGGKRVGLVLITTKRQKYSHKQSTVIQFRR